jgi:HK97 family phage major capsid protein
MDAVLAQVGDERDLVDAERSLLEACRQRIAEIDAQIEPLAAYEALRDQARERSAELPHPPIPAAPRRADPERAGTYPSVGAFLVDYMRAHGYMDAQRTRDEQAAARIAAAYQTRADQTTADTPGILPTPIVGGVVSLIDANRPLITSLGGAKSLGGIPGKTFTRPTIAQHVQVGPQAGEKQALPSQKMNIVGIPFDKRTYGGSVDISRQDMDFTQPGAWDILVRDLADVYAHETEAAVSDDFTNAAAGVPVDVGAAGSSPSLAEWSTALYTAAMRSYNAGKQMPDRVWCSLDVWASLGALVDVARLALPPSGDLDEAAGSSSLANFRGDVIGLPRIVVPTFSDGTCIVGPSSLFEAYEEVIGLLSVIEPSILGVEVAYGGYVADGALFGGAFVPLQVLGTLPSNVQPDAPAPAPERKANNGGK